MTYRASFLFALVAGLSSSVAVADAPALQSPSPVIYLEDNLDEKDKLGWCIDTKGRGFTEMIHAHSCKPKGGDTQFKFDEATGQLMSVAFDNKCVVLHQPDDPNVPFGLYDCDAEAQTQRFTYDSASMEIRLAADASRCVVVGGASRSAGPFMSRDLVTAPCAETDPLNKRWIVKP